MIKAQREDRALGSCLAVDGSRGPRGVAQLGTLTLAQKTGGVLLPVAASTADCRIYHKSWDRTVIPKRHAQIRILIGEPIEVAPRLDVTQLNLLRASLERRLLSMHAELDARTGADVIALFDRLNRDGMTIVVVTHDEKLAGAARRVVWTAAGGAPSASNPATSLTRACVRNSAARRKSLRM